MRVRDINLRWSEVGEEWFCNAKFPCFRSLKKIVSLSSFSDDFFDACGAILFLIFYFLYSKLYHIEIFSSMVWNDKSFCWRSNSWPELELMFSMFLLNVIHWLVDWLIDSLNDWLNDFDTKLLDGNFPSIQDICTIFQYFLTWSTFVYRLI